MSGTANSRWAYSDEKDHVALANRIAEDLGKPTNSIDDLVELLKTTPGDTLKTSLFLETSMKTTRFKFAPIIESVPFLMFVYFFFRCVILSFVQI